MLTLKKFSSLFCAPCVRFSPTVEKVCQQYFSNSIRLEKIDIDLNTEEARKYSVRSIPCLVLIGEQGEILWKNSGMMSEVQLLNALKQFTNRDI